MGNSFREFIHKRRRERDQQNLPQGFTVTLDRASYDAWRRAEYDPNWDKKLDVMEVHRASLSGRSDLSLGSGMPDNPVGFRYMDVGIEVVG